MGRDNHACCGIAVAVAADRQAFEEKAFGVDAATMGARRAPAVKKREIMVQRTVSKIFELLLYRYHKTGAVAETGGGGRRTGPHFAVRSRKRATQILLVSHFFLERLPLIRSTSRACLFRTRRVFSHNGLHLRRLGSL